jgi:hypothetical protein
MKKIFVDWVAYHECERCECCVCCVCVCVCMHACMHICSIQTTHTHTHTRRSSTGSDHSSSRHGGHFHAIPAPLRQHTHTHTHTYIHAHIHTQVNAALALVAIALHLVTVVIFVPYQRLSDNVRSILLACIELIAVIFMLLPRATYEMEHRYMAITIIAGASAVCFAAVVVLFHSLYLLNIMMESKWTPPPSEEGANTDIKLATPPLSGANKYLLQQGNQNHGSDGDALRKSGSVPDVTKSADGFPARNYAAALRSKTRYGMTKRTSVYFACIHTSLAVCCYAAALRKTRY